MLFLDIMFSNAFKKLSHRKIVFHNFSRMKINFKKNLRQNFYKLLALKKLT